jgi:hypothetical protein
MPATALSGRLAAFRSPNIFTKPPSGTRLIFQRVRALSVQPKSSGPNPMEKTSTRTPLRRATR